MKIKHIVIAEVSSLEATYYAAYPSRSIEPLYQNESASDVIQWALDTLEGNGGKLVLEPGCYDLTTTLKIPSQIHFSGAGSSSILRLSADTSDTVALLLSHAHHTSISDLFIEAEPGLKVGSGLQIDYSADIQVHQVFARHFPDYGIILRNGSSFCTLNHCKAADNQKANFCLECLDHYQDKDYGDFVPNLVNACYAYGGGVGFALRRALCQNLVGCVVYQAGKQAYHLSEWSNSTLISGCRSFQTEAQAVLIEDSSEINISSSIFCWQRGHGIELKNATWGTISANEIMDSGASSDSYKYNIYMHTDVKSFQVSGNCIFTWADQRPTQSGVYEDETCKNNNFIGNSINYFKEKGLISQGESSVAAFNHLEKKAYPNPGADPFAKPSATYGSYDNPFDRIRMQNYFKETSTDNK